MNGADLPKELKDIWTDAYKFHATFAGMGNSPDEWERCAAAMGHLILKHKSHPFAGELFMTIYEWLNEERKAIALAEAERRAGIA